MSSEWKTSGNRNPRGRGRGAPSTGGGQQPRPQQQPQGCFNCGNGGHFSRECPEPNRGGPNRGGPNRNPQQSNQGNFVPRDQGGYNQSAGRNAGFQQRQGGDNRQSSGAGAGAAPSKSMPSSVEHKALVPSKHSSSAAPLRTFPVLANFYRIVVSDIVVQHYDVAIDFESKGEKKKPAQSQPPSTSAAAAADATGAEVEDAMAALAIVDEKKELFIKKFSSDIFAAFKDAHPDYFTNGNIIYDGYKQLYSVRMLSIPEKEFPVKVKIQGREKSFKIKIKHVETIDLSQANDFFQRKVSEIPERVFSVLEIIFKRLITDAGFTSFQRKYFDVNGESELYNCYELIRGFLSGVRMTEFGLALNVHLKATAILAKSYKRLDHLVGNLLGLQNKGQLENMQLRQFHLNKVNDTIKNLVIYVCHGQKMNFKVAKLTDLTPKTHSFEFQPDGESPKRMISTYEYFRLKYPTVSISPNLPMVLLTKKKTYMPLDLCLIKDVHFMSTRLLKDEEVQSKLLSFSTLSPTVYFNSASKIVNRIASGSSEAVKRDFGLEQFSLEAVRLNAHQLNAPTLLCPGRYDKFYQPQTALIKFAMVCLDPTINVKQLKAFVDEMVDEATKKGLKMQNIRPFKIVTQNEIRCHQDVEDVCGQIDRSGGLNYVFFVFPSKLFGYTASNGSGNTNEIYNTVKVIFDQKLGLMSQGINSKHVFRGPGNGYFNQFLLKTNGKMDGINTAIDERTLTSIKGIIPGSMMLVGVDVFHPGSTDEVQSSIAAAVGSYDKGFTRFSASIRVQKKENKDREMIVQIGDMMVELLQQYKKRNEGRLPTSIFIFRDGVSEGQLAKLKTIELKEIEAAVKKVVGTKATTKLTLICVMKRHHTRFAHAEVKLDHKGKPANVPKGTVVDSMIIDPNNEEFYLASHDSPLGTTKPCKYIKIRDDLRLSMADLQKFCYYSCHQCTRTRTPLSYPTAIKYADLCAYRSGAHIKVASKESSYSRMNSEERERKIISDLNDAVKVNEKLQHTLYYS